jgi:hypothetical protein
MTRNWALSGRLPTCTPTVYRTVRPIIGSRGPNTAKNHSKTISFGFNCLSPFSAFSLRPSAGGAGHGAVLILYRQMGISYGHLKPKIA